MAAQCTGLTGGTDNTILSPLCACKGVRSCLLCENLKQKAQKERKESKVVRSFVYVSKEERVVCTDGGGSSFPFPGVFLWEDFISEEEERELLEHMDLNQWRLSQSGRRKQDFGPKVNFKKRKVRLGHFNGLPAVSRGLVERMQQNQRLADFKPVEQCNLDYSPERGAHIEPHLDDAWLWGERLVTVSLLSDTTLSLSQEGAEVLSQQQEGAEVRVSVPLPRRSLLLLSGPARHIWKHAIYRTDIHERRVCSTFRELSGEFSPGGAQAGLGAELLHTALNFTGMPL